MTEWFRSIKWGLIHSTFLWKIINKSKISFSNYLRGGKGRIVEVRVECQYSGSTRGPLGEFLHVLSSPFHFSVFWLYLRILCRKSGLGSVQAAREGSEVRNTPRNQKKPWQIGWKPGRPSGAAFWHLIKWIFRRLWFLTALTFIPWFNSVLWSIDNIMTTVYSFCSHLKIR